MILASIPELVESVRTIQAWVALPLTDKGRRVDATFEVKLAATRLVETVTKYGISVSQAERELGLRKSALWLWRLPKNARKPITVSEAVSTMPKLRGYVTLVRAWIASPRTMSEASPPDVRSAITMMHGIAEEHRLNKGQLAEAIGITRSQFSQMLRAAKTPRRLRPSDAEYMKKLVTSPALARDVRTVKRWARSPSVNEKRAPANADVRRAGARIFVAAERRGVPIYAVNRVTGVSVGALRRWHAAAFRKQRGKT